MSTRMTVGAVVTALVLAATLDAGAEARPTTLWRPASPSNYTLGRSRAIRMVVIHVTEGENPLGTCSWFANPAAHVSAHYVVGFDGTTYQCVADSNTAWHAGNTVYNQQSIGIEHSGHTYQNQWTDAQYRASAALTRWLCATYGIPRDRAHIIGHSEVPDPDGTGWGGANHHTDPGPYFNWAYYMQLLNGSNPSPSPTPSLTAQQVTAGTLNVRTGPGAGYAILGTVRSGQIYVANAASSGWHRIYYDQRTGWCSDAYLTRRTGGIGRRVTAGTLNVRSGPGTSYGIVGTAYDSEVFVADTLTSNWLRIWYRGAQSWIYAGYTTNVQF